MDLKNRQKNILEKLLIQYFYFLEENNINYCVIGNYKQLPQYTTNDVDFWVEDKEKAEKLLLELAKNLNIKLYMQNKTANGTNNYFYYKYEDNSVKIIKIDLMTETAYKSIIPIVTSEIIQNNRKKYKNFYVANELVEGIMHLFYPLITFGFVKEKYRDKIFTLISNNEYRNEIINILGSDEGKKLISNIENTAWEKIEKDSKKIKNIFIFKTLKTFDLKRVKIIISFFSTIVNRIFTKNGLVISFTGIDGAGKTSIKNYFVENSEKFFTKNRTKEFYWRPFLLPRVATIIKSQGQKEVLDNSGRRVLKKTFTTKIKNYLKYSYYILDFIFGQIKYFKESHTGGLVIFDRYHFDNVIYPERFGFTVNKKIMRFMDKWIVPQPDLLFYLTANSKTLYERKYEIDIDEINKQKEIYKKEIDLRGDIITISTDGSFNYTIEEILLTCLEFMSKRLEKHGQ